MKTLYTEREKVRYLNVLFFGFFILYAMMDIYYDGFYVMFTKNLVVFIQVFGIIEVILLCIWYPKEYRKKEAQKNGQVYEGRITDIQLKKRTGIGLARTSHIYTMTVECNIDGDKKIIELGNYMENPRDYVPKDYRCKVFYYKGKCYLENFSLRNEAARNRKEKDDEEEDTILLKVLYGEFDNKDISTLLKYPVEKLINITRSERLEAMLERDRFSPARSLKYIFTRSLVFSCPIPYFCLFVEVHMKSKKSYNAFDFDLDAKVQQFMDLNPICDTYGEEEFIAELTELVKREMISKDKRIQIENVYVVLK